MDRSCRRSQEQDGVRIHYVGDGDTDCAVRLVLLACLVLVLAGALIAGCGGSGPRRYEVSGSVSFAGAKVSEGTIAFVPVEGTQGPKAGANIQQGQYHIDRNGGPVAGRHRVEIRSFRRTGRKLPNMGGQMVIDEVVNELPEKYSGETSELAVAIDARAKNVFNFDLKAQ